MAEEEKPTQTPPAADGEGDAPLETFALLDSPAGAARGERPPDWKSKRRSWQAEDATTDSEGEGAPRPGKARRAKPGSKARKRVRGVKPGKRAREPKTGTEDGAPAAEAPVAGTADGDLDAGVTVKPGKADRALKPGKAAKSVKPRKADRPAKPGGRVQTEAAEGIESKPFAGGPLRRALRVITAVTALGMLVLSLLGLEASSDFFLATAVALPVLVLAYFAGPGGGAVTGRSVTVLFVLVAVGEGGALYALAADSSNPASVGLAVGGLAGIGLLITAALWIPRRPTGLG